MLKSFFSTPSIYKGKEEESTAKSLKFIFVLFESTALLVANDQFIRSEVITASVLVFSVILSVVPFILLQAGSLRLASMTFVILTIAMLTLICTVGNGIHDIAIMAFPLVIGYSSIFQSIRDIFISTVLIIAGVYWLAIGDAYGWYEVNKPGPVNSGSLITSFSIIVAGGLLSYVLMNNLNQSIQSANDESLRRKQKSVQLEKDLKYSFSLIADVNKKVVTSIHYIEALIDNVVVKEKSKGLSAKRRLLSLLVANSHLLQEKEASHIDGKGYIKDLIFRFGDLHNISRFKINDTVGDFSIHVEDAIGLGVCLLEVAYEICSKGGILHIVIAKNEEKLLTTMRHTGKSLSLSSDARLVFGTSLRQLKASYHIEETAIDLSHHISFEATR